MAIGLLDHAEKYEQARGIKALITYTQPEWLDAFGFYQHHGFCTYGQDSIDIHLHPNRRRLTLVQHGRSSAARFAAVLRRAG